MAFPAVFIKPDLKSIVAHLSKSELAKRVGNVRKVARSMASQNKTAPC